MDESRKVRILFLSASPRRTERVFAEPELQAIRTALGQRLEDFVLEPHLDVTADQFLAALAQPIDILHISAHAADGRIRLQDRAGREFIGIADLVDLIRLHKAHVRTPRIVVLNACDTEAGLAQLCEQVDCAIGMDGTIHETPAYLFSSTFYAYLARGLSVADAFEVAMFRLKMPEQPSHVPRLASAHDVDARRIVPLPLRGAPDGHVVRVIGNRYTITNEVLGRGATAIVHEAVDLCSDTHVHVALKLLRPEHHDNPILLDRFFRGAVEMQRLAHPSIVKILDIGPRQATSRYYTMTLVPGRKTLMTHVLSAQLDFHEVIALALQIGDALALAHDKKLFHRDVNPGNILVGADGRAYLVDFDLVREEFTAGGTITGTLGTPGYIPPESVGHARAATYANDQYGLAMSIAAVLAGRDPPARGSPEEFLATINIPESVRAVLLAAVSDRQEIRHGSMQAFCTALARSLTLTTPAPASRPAAASLLSASLTAASLTAASLTATSRSASASATFTIPPSAPPDLSPTPRLVAACLAIGALLMLAVWIFIGSNPDNEAPEQPAFAQVPMSVRPSASPAAEALQARHERTTFAIRIATEKTFPRALAHAEAIVRENRFSPWIIRDGDEYWVMVGDYSTLAAAKHGRDIARTGTNEGVLPLNLRNHCSTLQHHSDGYHLCLRSSSALP